MSQSGAQINVYNHAYKRLQTLSDENRRLKGYATKFIDDVNQSTDETLAPEQITHARI